MTDPSARTLEAAARIAHDLGLAASFGGTLFGKVVFNSSLPVVGSKTERGRLGAAFWNSANPINAAAFGLAVATWLPGRPTLLCAAPGPSIIHPSSAVASVMTIGPSTQAKPMLSNMESQTASPG